jgi:hypothetical protein
VLRQDRVGQLHEPGAQRAETQHTETPTLNMSQSIRKSNKRNSTNLSTSPNATPARKVIARTQQTEVTEPESDNESTHPILNELLKQQAEMQVDNADTSTTPINGKNSTKNPLKPTTAASPVWAAPAAPAQKNPAAAAAAADAPAHKQAATAAGATASHHPALENEPIDISIISHTHDIAKLIKTRPMDFQKFLNTHVGLPDEIIFGEGKVYVRFTDRKLAEAMEKTTVINGVTVECQNMQSQQTLNETEPENMDETPEKTYIDKCVIYGVPLSLTEDEIKNESQPPPVYVHRMTKRGQNNEKLPLQTVILGYEDEAPQTLKLCLVKYHTKTYIPLPRRCNKCQRFGHSADYCRATKPRCAYCSETHDFENCTKRISNEPKQCANCQGQHSAAYRECPKYLQVREALKLRATQNLTFKEALSITPYSHQPERKVTQTRTQTAETLPEHTCGKLDPNNINIMENLHLKHTFSNLQESMQFMFSVLFTILDKLGERLGIQAFVQQARQIYSSLHINQNHSDINPPSTHSTSTSPSTGKPTPPSSIPMPANKLKSTNSTATPSGPSITASHG